MKKIISFLLSFLLGLAFFWFVFEKVIDWQELKSVFLSFSFPAGLLILLLAFLSLLLEVLRWKEVLKSKGQHFSTLELLGPYLACFGIIYLAPITVLGADFFRARALKNSHSQPSEKILASAFIDRILSSIANLVIIFIGSFIFLSKTDFLPGDFNLIFLGFVLFLAFILIFFIVIFSYSNIFKKNRLLRFFLNSKQEALSREIKKEIFSFFGRENFHFLKASLGLSFLRVIVNLIQVWLLVFFLGTSLSFLSLLAVFGVSTAALETPISADLGSHDLATALVFQHLGFEKTTGIAFALVLRGTNLVLTFLGAVYFLRFSLRALKERLFKKIDKFALPRQ